MFTIFDVLRRLVLPEPLNTIEADVARRIIDNHEATTGAALFPPAGSEPSSGAGPADAPGSATPGEQPAPPLPAPAPPVE